MWGRLPAAGALLALAALPLSAALAKPAPGALFVGAPAGFGTDRMHLRVAPDGKAMALVGSFAWSYGCRVIGNYGVADPRTLKRLHGTPIAMFRAPTLLINGSSFSGSEELQRDGRRYGRLTVSGRFTGGRSARASFSMNNPPHCGRFTENFTLRAG